MRRETLKKYANIKSRYIQEHPELLNKTADEIKGLVDKEVNNIIK